MVVKALFDRKQGCEEKLAGILQSFFQLPLDFLEKAQTRLINSLETGIGYHLKLSQLVAAN